MALCKNLHIVLHQIHGMDNLGAVARLMANFNLTKLCLSEPNTLTFQDAAKMAVRATHVLDAMRVSASLSEALEGVVYAVGTTSREGAEGRASLSPEDAVARLHRESARGAVALVFGGEKRGLSDADLSACQDVLVIPTSHVQPSMNLAQSAAVLLYLCAKEDVAVAPPPAVQPGAALKMVHVLEAKMRASLVKAGFLNAQQPELVLRELVHALTRGKLTQREAELWLTAFKQLERAVQK